MGFLCCNKPRVRKSTRTLRNEFQMKIKFEKIHNGVSFDGTEDDGLEDTSEPVALQVKQKAHIKQKGGSEKLDELLTFEDIKLKLEIYKQKWQNDEVYEKKLIDVRKLLDWDLAHNEKQNIIEQIN